MTADTGDRQRPLGRIAWISKMAWRDSRRSRSKLLLAAGCIMIGISGLVATASFRENVGNALDRQARTLLGADLVVRSRQPFTEETDAVLRDLGGDQSLQTSFASMAYFPKSGGTRLVRVRALAGAFPYYGELETDPPDAAAKFRSGASALVDDALLIQFDAGVGDPIKLGDATLEIVGRLTKIPGETAVQSFIGPRVYIPHAQLPTTGLIKPGSRTSHRRFFKFDEGTDREALRQELAAKLRQPGIRIETVETRKERLGNALANVTRFLNLVGFVAVLLGALAVGSAMHVYIKQKVATVGLLRCLGAPQSAIFAVYLLQGAAVACLGALAGSLLGVGLQQILPTLLADFLPARVEFALNFGAVFEGASVGLATALLFAALPLLSTRSITALQVLSGAAGTRTAGLGTLGLAACSILLLVGAFALVHTASWQQAASFTGGLLGAVLILGLTAQGMIRLTRTAAPAHLGYIWRQGLANLYRPQNQTPVLLLSLGLATFLVATIYQSQQMLLAQVSRAEQQSDGNFVLFDVQADQVEPLKRVLRSFGLEPDYGTPIVSMRLNALNGVPVHQLRDAEGKKEGMEDWALTHEYRATYRDHLIETEKLIEGAWPPQTGNGAGPHPISLEKDIARSLGVALGDELVFDVQGVPITTRVGSIREVEWRRLRPNFFVVFPPGILEEAPQTQALMTRVISAELSAKLQRSVVQQFPNVSMIDLRLLLDSLTTLLDRVALAIRFLGSFSVFVGLFVLLGTISATRYHRFRENLLLRTLGASRRQIIEINALEYFFLGLVAALAGLALSLAASWILGTYLFDSTPVVDWVILGWGFVLVTALTIVTGLLGSWGTLDQPPLELLRGEGS